MTISKKTKTWAAGAGIVGVPMVIVALLYLNSVGAITINSYSGDMVCAGTLMDKCIAEINFTANKNTSLTFTKNDTLLYID